MAGERVTVWYQHWQQQQDEDGKTVSQKEKVTVWHEDVKVL